MSTDIQALDAAHKRSINHRAQIEASDHCACFYCEAVFAPTRIEDRVDDDQTALCPVCGIDSVIGSAAGFTLDVDFLRAMHRHWFNAKTN